MNIIFGDPIESIPDSFTILPLDSFRAQDSTTPVTAWAVIEKIPLAELATSADNVKIHKELLEFYRQRQWNYCEHAIEGLMGHWNGELDSFYTNLLKRVMHLKENPPSDDWDGFVGGQSK